MGFPGGSDGKESACNVEDLGSIPGLGRSPGEGSSYPLQCSFLENSMDMVVGYSPWVCRVRQHWVTFTSLQQRWWEWTMSSWENVQNKMRKGLRQILEVLGVVEILEWGRRWQRNMSQQIILSVVKQLVLIMNMVESILCVKHGSKFFYSLI